MATAKIEYLGELRTKCTHLASGEEIITDAPVDNNGKGETFSPTDLVASAYASCMLTIVGIYCDKSDITFNSGVISVKKIMDSDPRRIGRLELDVDFSNNDWDEKTKVKVQRAAENCPVAKTVSDDVEVVFNYIF